MNDVPDPATELVAFGTICVEATRRYGDDWHAVERHIRARIDALPQDQRARLAKEMDRILRYAALPMGARTQ